MEDKTLQLHLKVISQSVPHTFFTKDTGPTCTSSSDHYLRSSTGHLAIPFTEGCLKRAGRTLGLYLQTMACGSVKALVENDIPAVIFLEVFQSKFIMLVFFPGD